MALELEIGEMDVENPVLTTYVMLQNTISSFSTFADPCSSTAKSLQCSSTD